MSTADITIEQALSNPYRKTLVERLPAVGAAKLAAAKQQATDARALMRSTMDDLDRAREVEHDLTRQQRHYAHEREVNHGTNKAEETRVARELVNIEREIKRLSAQRDDRQEKWATKDRQARRLESYLTSIGGSDDFDAYAGPDPAATLAAPPDLEALRDHVAEIKAEIHRVQSAPEPRSQIKAKVAAHVSMLAARGEVDASQFLDGRVFLRWPQARHDLGIGYNHKGEPVSLGQVDIPDLTSVVAWLFEKELTKRLLTQIDQLAGDDAEAITEPERRKQLAVLRADLLRVERIEEAACEALGVDRRADADARAVLGLADSLPAPAGEP